MKNVDNYIFHLVDNFVFIRVCTILPCKTPRFWWITTTFSKYFPLQKTFFSVDNFIDKRKNVEDFTSIFTNPQKFCENTTIYPQTNVLFAKNVKSYPQLSTRIYLVFYA